MIFFLKNLLNAADAQMLRNAQAEAPPSCRNTANCCTCRGNKELLLLSVRKMFSSIQDLGPSDPPERGNLGGAMTLLEKGFFRGEAWLTDPGTPIPLPLRWSRPQDIPPEPQPLPWWLPQGDGFTMGCRDTQGWGGGGGVEG